MRSELTRQELVDAPDRQEPHVVILGAGASKAAFPDGDANGQLVPLMSELPKVLGSPWKDLVGDANLTNIDFESQFTHLRNYTNYHDRLNEIEEMLVDHFSSLALPSRPTIYDYLILGLRGKDVIATFNWDPFLILAYKRNRTISSLPEIRFLHGCVQYASCHDHDVLGQPGERCPECRELLTKSPIQFPHSDKDYPGGPIMSRDWHFVTNKLRIAFHLTIFGYSGPATDYKAKKLLLEGWEQTPFRPLSHVEIIDAGDADDLRKNWREFIPFHHDMLVTCFWKSTIARWPRRTVEYKTSASWCGTVSEDIGPFRTTSLVELQEWHTKIAAAEQE